MMIAEIWQLLIKISIQPKPESLIQTMLQLLTILANKDAQKLVILSF